MLRRFASSRPLLVRHRRSRTASTTFFVVGAMALIAIVVLAAIFFTRQNGDDVSKIPLLKEVIEGPYDHVVLEQGEVESSNNVEIRCEIRSRSGGTGPATSIIDVVPEGTVVKEGDWLITFDSSNLEQEMSRQRIVVNTSEAIMIQAKATFDTASIAKDEYVNGTYNEETKMVENEIFVAEENLKKAQLSFESIKRLVSRGLLTALQLEGEKFRVDAAQNELDLARQKLEVLEKFTKRKMLTQLDSDIAAAEVRWKNEQDSHQEELNNLKEIEDQLNKCKVIAPQAGQVVYANVTSSRSGSEFVVEAGVAVRERQVIVRLPDPELMQIRAKINESRINLVSEGLPVTIRIDAFGDKTVQGEVTKVNKYAEPGNFWSSSAKEYVTLIKILEPPPEIRVGLTAEVSIHIEHSESATQLPVTAIYEQGGKTFCLVENGDAWDTREILIISTNSQEMAAVNVAKSDPLRAGEKVVMNPRKHLDKFDKSRFPKPSDAAPVADVPTVGSVMKAKKSKQGGGKKGKAGGGAPNEMIQRLDSNSDGKVTMDELPERLRSRMTGADTNSDGTLSAAELTAAFAKMQAAGGGPGGGGPGGGGGPPGGNR
ncbi:MAG: HlyD family efflux transporter periplasmic adaptor subunit [Pirellulaceae bacterium]|nr:HlyD family efflux transporter periplasmic adaptor subunit [Pirellulaceae bacterium]MDP6554088.1 HlyD family efflux transporter periplasmic adaptor subunit [Pirellulaceae bacterium]